MNNDELFLGVSGYELPYLLLGVKSSVPWYC